jgi:hypothetical protein
MKERESEISKGGPLLDYRYDENDRYSLPMIFAANFEP